MRLWWTTDPSGFNKATAEWTVPNNSNGRCTQHLLAVRSPHHLSLAGDCDTATGAFLNTRTRNVLYHLREILTIAPTIFYTTITGFTSEYRTEHTTLTRLLGTCMEVESLRTLCSPMSFGRDCQLILTVTSEWLSLVIIIDLEGFVPQRNTPLLIPRFHPINYSVSGDLYILREY